MPSPYYYRAVAALAGGSLLLGAGVALQRSGDRALDAAEARQAIAAKAAQDLEAAERHASGYADLIRQLGWRPGLQVRQEKIDTVVTISSNELQKFGDLLAVTHSGRGRFFLQSFSIEPGEVRDGSRAAPALKVALKGENVLVVERP